MEDGVLDAFAHFTLVTDPRKERGRRHKLLDIIIIALCGAICGVDNAVDLEAFGEAKEKWFRTFLELPFGIPSQDTFLRVFALLDPDEFRLAFVAWVEGLRAPGDGQVLAVDGKTLRRAFSATAGKLKVHMVSAYLSEAGLVLASLKTDVKSNEITAIPRLLAMLNLHGLTTTTDAMGCQRKIAEQIVDQGGDYMLQVAGNHPTLHEEVALYFEGIDPSIPEVSVQTTTDKGHGRVEVRTYLHSTDVGWFEDRQRWAGLASFAAVTSRRTDLTKGTESLETRYYISSYDQPDARRAGHAIRAHWGVENGLHWVLDMAFDEDRSRCRTGHAAETFAIVRHVALNLLKKEKSRKGGIASRRKLCGWDHDYLLQVIGLRSTTAGA